MSPRKLCLAAIALLTVLAAVPISAGDMDTSSHSSSQASNSLVKLDKKTGASVWRALEGDGASYALVD